MSSTTETKSLQCGDPWVFDAFKLLPVTSKVLFIIRGLPGSGKSTLARILADAFHTEHWYEADMYFEGPEGYKFDGSKIADAHDWCSTKTMEALRLNSPCVIVSNTFTKLWEFAAYEGIAHMMDYQVQVIECKGNFGSVHGVPSDVVKNMKNRWEQYDSKGVH